VVPFVVQLHVPFAREIASRISRVPGRAARLCIFFSPHRGCLRGVSVSLPRSSLCSLSASDDA